MASGFFALLDDVAALMDDVAAMSKLTTKKTAGILGDDLAVNAEKASGFVSSRELPVLWAITKGSFINKLIILPLAFLLSAFLPQAVTLILLLGGVYLAYEGAEKVYAFLVSHPRTSSAHAETVLAATVDRTEEKKKIKSAILTDFILSVEIVIIALGTVADKPLLFQILVVSVVALIATAGVYGVVALLVRMDDLGFRLVQLGNGKGFLKVTGNLLVQALPKVIKTLSVIGTLALLLVSGGIFAHHVEFMHTVLVSWPAVLRDFVIGLAVGSLAFFLLRILKGLYTKCFTR